jgi:hypothetical protein
VSVIVFSFAMVWNESMILLPGTSWVDHFVMNHSRLSCESSQYLAKQAESQSSTQRLAYITHDQNRPCRDVFYSNPV